MKPYGRPAKGKGPCDPDCMDPNCPKHSKPGPRYKGSARMKLRTELSKEPREPEYDPQEYVPESEAE